VLGLSGALVSSIFHTLIHRDSSCLPSQLDPYLLFHLILLDPIEEACLMTQLGSGPDSFGQQYYT